MLASGTGGRSLAAAVAVNFCNFFAACNLLAQTPADLQQLVFYPAPLAIPAVARVSDAVPGSGALLVAFADEAGTVHALAGFQEAGIDRQLQDIGTLQTAEGPFAPGLIPRLLELGLAYQAGGQHAQAIDAFEQAAAISRVNNGLYSPEQITLTGHVIDSLVQSGRFTEVEDKHLFLLNLYRQHYGADAPETATALKELAQWKLESFHLGLEQAGGGGQMLVAQESRGLFTDYDVYSAQFGELYQAQAMFVDAIRLLIESEEWTDPALFELEQDLVRTFFINANRELVIRNPRSYAANDEPSRDRMRRESRKLALPEDYSKGEAAYRRMIGYLKKNPDATIGQIADVMLGLADWHLLFGREDRAEEQYRLLEKLLVKAQTPAWEASRILQPSVPVTLPVFLESAISAKPLSDAAAYKGYVDVALNINRHGRAGNIEVLGSSADNNDTITDRLVDLVRNAQFRPAADDGSARTGIRYYYTY